MCLRLYSVPARAGLILAFLFITAQSALGDVTRMLFTPPVVPENYTQPIRFEATVTGAPASVVFEYNLADRPMFDNGTNGDQVAGDGVWTILFQPNEILGKLTPGSVFRPFIGYVKPGDGNRYNIFAEVWTSAIPFPAVRQLDPAAQATDYIVNFVLPRSELLAPNFSSIAKRFYAIYPDTVDFLNIVSVGGPRGNRGHLSIRNSVTGIGKSIIDSTSTYGSSGRLMGINVFPISYFFDGASKGYVHETGHAWINFLNQPPFASGVPHWPRGSLATNVMGFSIGGTGGQGGNYPYSFTPNGQGGYIVASEPTESSTAFNSMELYLMGLVSPAEVGTFFVLNDQNQNVVNGQVLQPSEITLVGVNDVIAAFGPRVPGSDNSPHAFRAATIVLSEQPLDNYALSFYDWFARRAEATEQLPCTEAFGQYTCKPFYLATGGRASLSVRLDAPRSSLTRLRGDFNGDGKSDILWQHADGSAAIWLMDGLNMSAGAGLIGPGTGWAVRKVGDFNGDGKSDILWQHTDGRTTVWLMNGLGPSSGGGLLEAGTGWSPGLVGDFNADGKSDILWQHTDGSSAIWLMDGLSFTSAERLLGGDAGWSARYLGDFNADGKSDIVWQHTDGSSAIWLMDGLSMSSGDRLLGADTGWSVRETGDFNGDDKTDILWQHTDGRSTVWLMNGLNLSIGGGLLDSGTGWRVIRIGEFNGDGKDDIFWEHFDGRSAIWLMNGLTMINGGGLLGMGTGWRVNQIGEFDSDGKDDIVWQHANGSIAAWSMNGLNMTTGAGLLGAGTGWTPAP